MARVGCAEGGFIDHACTISNAVADKGQRTW